MISIRLGKFFGVDPRWFLNMQTDYDITTMSERMAVELESIETFKARATEDA